MSTPTYCGIAFPPQQAHGSGFFALAEDTKLILGNIKTILYTKKGEMPMVPEFGNSSYDLLFQPQNRVTQQLIADAVASDIEAWEPRVYVDKVIVQALENTIILTLDIRYKSTNTTETISVPLETT